MDLVRGEGNALVRTTGAAGVDVLAVEENVITWGRRAEEARDEEGWLGRSPECMMVSTAP